MNVDYIIVGFGLSGLSFVEQLEKNGKSFMVYEDSSQTSSRVAGGIYNPVVLKRFTLAWQASEQLRVAVSFYKDVEDKLCKKLVEDLPVLRRFNSVEEQNNWFESCGNLGLNEFLSSELVRSKNTAIDAPFHYGKVKHTGKIDINNMLFFYSEYLHKNNKIIKDSFDYDKIEVKEGLVCYKNIVSKHIVFTEGFGMKNNPFFNHLPLQGNKGEYIIIKSEALQLKEAIKSSVFIIPLGQDMYKVGATYNNEDKTSGKTLHAKEELQKKLERFLKVPYSVVDQVAGIRPTVKDRKPLIGTHTDYQNIHILNGLGSRGILIGPTVAKKLYDHIENGVLLDKDIDIKRFNILG
ncbi:NAD(P)/FAD-dependent oxidoreductase [Aquimarina muelleri]|uniref:FAD-dependent oxidoreductase n=1 Tax=Aquimarina muelleri TaxID=279356 RepID=A0A918N505_9FLAO|nr:FAD-binding oxidoreductase [Aquimarina muelleri]MCX2763634.1 FAD-binding oxidoreductase [Aquimarina muelleri]GGX26705.1 FAD-dependent oxidoreductase [Aquimarina muelleri]